MTLRIVGCLQSTTGNINCCLQCTHSSGDAARLVMYKMHQYAA